MKYVLLVLICATQLITSPATAQCNSAFTFTISENTVSFVPTVTDTLHTVHSWYFGDGTSEYAAYAKHSYNAPGQFTVRHLISDSVSGCIDSSSQVINLNFTPTCSVSIQYNKDYVQPNQYVFYAYPSTTEPTNQFTWKVNDSIVPSESYLPYIFPKTGTYTVCVTFETAAGCKAEKCQQIEIFSIDSCPLGQPTFTAKSDANNHLKFSFKPAPDSNKYLYNWYFGDGGVSTERYPNHTYSQSGQFLVKLVVFSSGAADSCSAYAYNYVYTDTPKQCSVAVDIIGDNSNHSRYSFYTNTNNPVKNTIWRINDSIVSNDKYFNHTFTDTGYFNICVRIETQTGCVAENCKALYVTDLDSCKPLNASFIATADSTNPLKIAFKSIVDTIGSSYWWNFGDNSNYSNAVNPTHTYANPGSYNVTFQVRGYTGDSCLTTVQQVVTVVRKTDSCHLPLPSFTAYADSTNPLLIHFKQTVAQPSYSALWQFGDGYTSTENSPSHLYGKPGNYFIQLLIKTGLNNDTCTASTSQLIIVKKDSSLLCKVTIISWQDSVRPTLYHFVAKPEIQAIPANKYTWSMNGNLLAAYDSLNFAFPDTGTFTMCVKMETPNGCVAEDCQQIHVTSRDTCQPLLASFIAIADSINPLRIKFKPTPDNAAFYYEWSFGDSTTTSWDRSPTHTYSSAGLYYANLFVRSNQPGTCSGVSRQAVNVQLPEPVTCSASFNWRPDSTGTVAPNKLHFVATSTQTIASQQWTIYGADSNTIKLSQNNPTHIFADTGYYQVCLKATFANGCVANYCEWIHIKEIDTQDSTQTTTDNTVKLYPNPATNEMKFYLDLTVSSQVKITIYNSQGMPVKQETRNGFIGNNQLKINIQTLQTGLYFSEIIYGTQRKTARFQKQ